MTDFAPSLADYPYHIELTTRAQDCDALGHIGNVVFYSFFDTVVNQFLNERCNLSVASDTIVPFVTSSQCQYMSKVSYPESVFVGLRVIKIARSTVTFGVSVYAGENGRRAAHGQLMQVFVERSTDKAVPIPGHIKTELNKLAGELT